MSKKYDWPALIAAQEDSGLSQAEFCRQHGIDPRYFSLRKGQLRRKDAEPGDSGQAAKADASQAFVRAVPAGSSPAEVELTLTCGVLRFGEGTDPAYVARLVAALS